MQIIGEASEPEMIAHFLQTEIRSPRYADKLLHLLARDGVSRTIVDHPNIANDTENAYRFQLLTNFRGYGHRQDTFQNFPHHVQWQRAVLSPDELLQVKYTNWDYWLELSGGSRRPTDAATAIRAGRTIYDVANDGFLAMAEALRQGARFPDLILVWAGEGTHLVVLEGHARLTAYALAPDSIPLQVPVILGTSPDMPGLLLTSSAGSWQKHNSIFEQHIVL